MLEQRGKCTVVWFDDRDANMNKHILLVCCIENPTVEVYKQGKAIVFSKSRMNFENKSCLKTYIIIFHINPYQ